MTIVVYTAPSVEPVTLDEALHRCRVDDDSYNGHQELNSKIKAARKVAENMLGRYLITQTLDKYYDCFPNIITLPPIQSVTAITYFDTAGAEQTLATDQYLVDAESIPGRVTESYGNTWPSTRDQSNAVKVRFVAGYGLAADVPEEIKVWMFAHITASYDKENPLIGVDSLLDSEKVWGRL